MIGTKSTEPAQPAEGSEVSTAPTVNELLVEFLEYAQAYYRHQDAAAKTYSAYVIAAKWLRQDAGRELAEDFGPKRLRKGMIVDQCNA